MEIAARLQQCPLDPAWQRELASFCQENQTYIVRSSALLEDGQDLSFAGQYDSIGNCRTLSEIEQGIRSCLLSLFNPEALAYWHRQGLAEQDFAMAVLIQEQIEPDFSGVCFSLDVATNQDQTMLLEYVKGSAESLESASPQQSSGGSSGHNRSDAEINGWNIDYFEGFDKTSLESAGWWHPRSRR